MDKTRQLTLNEKWLRRLQQDFLSASITDEEMCNALQEMYELFEYVADPHTAVAIGAAKKLGYLLAADENCSRDTTQQVQQAPPSISSESRRPVVIVATASPCKFEETVTIALGKETWEKWKSKSFPSRALETMEMDEVQPFHYQWDRSRYFTLREVQSEWRGMMLNIVMTNFSGR